MHLNAVFRCKESEFDPKACVVDKIVELDYREYEDFRSNMLRDQPFIAEFNSTLRPSGDGTLHCLLVLGEDHEDGVLIDTQGYDYARYSALIPGARKLCLIEEMHAEQMFSNQIRQIQGADLTRAPTWIEHARELAETNTGAYGPDVHVEYLRLLREFGDAFERIDRLYLETPAEIFNYKAGYRPEELLPACDYISNGADVEEAYEMAPKGACDPLNYAVSRIIEDGLQLETDGIVHHGYDETQGAYGLNSDQMSQLWQRLRDREEIGELLLHENRAAFTLCFKPEYLKQGKHAEQPEPLMQEDLAVMHARHMLWCYDQPDGVQADFSGLTLSNLDFEGMSFCGADFADATIHQCRMGYVCFDDSDFSGAKLRGVSAYQAEFNGAKFRGATLEYSEFEEAQFEGADFTRADISNCDGLDDVSQGPAMVM
jgi:hypothetical protein